MRGGEGKRGKKKDQKRWSEIERKKSLKEGGGGGKGSKEKGGKDEIYAFD